MPAVLVLVMGRAARRPVPASRMVTGALERRPDAPGDLLRMDEDASMATRSPGLPAASAQCGSTHTTVARFFGENRANRWSACAERRRRLLWLAPLLDHGVSLTYGRRWHRAPDLLSLRLGPSPRRRGHKPPTSVSHTVAVGVSAHLIFRGSGTAVDDSAQYPAGVAPTPGITTKGDRAACSVRLPAVRPGTRPGTRRGGERRTAPEQPCWGAVSKAERIAVRDTGRCGPGLLLHPPARCTGYPDRFLVAAPAPDSTRRRRVNTAPGRELPNPATMAATRPEGAFTGSAHRQALGGRCFDRMHRGIRWAEDASRAGSEVSAHPIRPPALPSGFSRGRQRCGDLAVAARNR